MDKKKRSIVNTDMELSDKEVESVAAGMISHRRYTCVNPACSMYLRYLDFQPPLGKCEECRQNVGEVL